MGADRLSPPAPTTRSRYKWWVVAMLWFVCLFNYADRQAIFAIFPVLKKEFGFDTVQLGWIGSAFMWVYAAGAPVAGFIGDRTRRKDLILGGCLFWSFVTVSTSWCQKLWHFVTVRALEGVGETFYFPASMSLISDYHSAGTRSKAMSFHQSSVYIGTILGSWAGAWFASTRLGWRAGFYCFGGAGMVLALVLYTLLREPRRGQSEPAPPTEEELDRPTVGEALFAILRSPAALVLMLVFVGANSVAAVFLTWAPTFLVEKFHFQLTTAGLSGTVFIHLASAVSVPMGGALADRLARQFAGGRMMVQAAGLVLGAGFVRLVGTTEDVTILLLAMTVFGFGKGLYDSNIFASLYDVVPARNRALAAGIMNTAGWGGGAMGPVAVGWIAKHGHSGSEIQNMSYAITWGGVIYLSGAILLLAAITLFSGWARRGLP